MQNITQPEYPDATSVVCHDAGSANIVIANLLETGRHDWRAYMKGPAENVWNTVYPDINLCESLDSTLEQAELLVTGTGWQSNVEHDARKMARERGIHSVAVIDHWVNFEERFIRESETVWPDEFWVTDDYALEIAQQSFPDQCVRQVPNYYTQSQMQIISEVKQNDPPELLYLLEPMRDDWGRGKAGEFQALDYFVSRLPELELPADTVIRLRLHPSEASGKYSEWVHMHSTLDIRMDDADNLGQAIGVSTWLAGCETSALALGLMAGRKVYCTLPPWAPVCQLPHQGLIHLALQDLVR